MQQAIAKGDVLQRIAGISFIVGAIVLIVSNVLAPRPDDPTVTRETLTAFGQNETLSQATFLGVAVGMWLFLAGIAGVYRALSTGASAAWARLGFYGAVVGTAMWTVACALSLATAGAGADWLAASGTPGEATSFSIAAAVIEPQKAVFTMTVLVDWVALTLVGIAIAAGTLFPRWLGWVAIVLGVVTVGAVGIPQAFVGISQTAMILFGVLAGLTTLWGLVIGILITRKAW